MFQTNAIGNSPVQQEVLSPAVIGIQDSENLKHLKQALLKIKEYDTTGAETSLQKYLSGANDNFEKASAYIEVAEQYDDCATVKYNRAVGDYANFYSNWIGGNLSCCCCKNTRDRIIGAATTTCCVGSCVTGIGGLAASGLVGAPIAIAAAGPVIFSAGGMSSCCAVKVYSSVEDGKKRAIRDKELAVSNSFYNKAIENGKKSLEIMDDIENNMTPSPASSPNSAPTPGRGKVKRQHSQAALILAKIYWNKGETTTSLSYASRAEELDGSNIQARNFKIELEKAEKQQHTNQIIWSQERAAARIEQAADRAAERAGDRVVNAIRWG